MSNAEWTTLFEPFKRGDAEDERGGLGLGLSISRRIATTLGGQLTAEPGIDGATRFHLSVTLPEHDQPQSTRDPTNPGIMSILLVEDERLTRTAMHDGLSARGASVLAVATASEARTAMSSHSFAAFVFDTHLSDGDGADLAMTARHLYPAAAISVLTGTTDTELMRRVNEIGAVLLTKPVGTKELYATLTGERPSQAPTGPNTRDEGIFEAKSLAAALVANYELGAFEDMRFLAHKLCGLSALFELSELKDAANRIEQSTTAKEADISHLKEIVRSLDGDRVQ
jgi:CheY-like chemotaxis protein